MLKHYFFSSLAWQHETSKDDPEKIVIIKLPNGKHATGGPFDSQENGNRLYDWPDKKYLGAFEESTVKIV